MESFGLLGMQGFGFVVLIGFAFVLFYHARQKESLSISSTSLILMVFESLIWAGGLFVVLSILDTQFLTHTVKGFVHQVILSVGAGVYEELLFRVLLISGLASVIGFVFSAKKPVRLGGAIFISAIVFSLFHFFGSAGDSYSFQLFMLRMIGGIYLGIIYALRGFGMAAWTHSLYDILILLVMQQRG